VGEAMLQSERLNPEVRLLDYGCGTGLLGLYLLAHVKHVTGIDTSPGMLEVLRQKIVQSEISNMEVQLVDLQEPLESSTLRHSFGAATMNMVLHHVQEISALFANLKSLLTAGGTLFIADLDTEPGTFHGQEVPGVFHHGFDRDKLSDQLSEAGFTAVEIRTVHTMETEHKDGTVGNYEIFLATAEA